MRDVADVDSLERQPKSEVRGENQSCAAFCCRRTVEKKYSSTKWSIQNQKCAIKLEKNFISSKRKMGNRKYIHEILRNKFKSEYNWETLNFCSTIQESETFVNKLNYIHSNTRTQTNIFIFVNCNKSHNTREYNFKHLFVFIGDYSRTYF